MTAWGDGSLSDALDGLADPESLLIYFPRLLMISSEDYTSDSVDESSASVHHLTSSDPAVWITAFYNPR